MNDEPRKKLVALAVTKVFSEECSIELTTAREEIEVEITPSQPTQKKPRTSLFFLPAEHSYGTWKEGVTVLDFPVEELHGVIIGEHYYEAKTKVSHYKRRIAVNGLPYEPKMKATKRTLQ